MVELVSYQQAMDEANQIREGLSKDKILMVVFAMSNCEVCKPWLEQVMEPISENMKSDLTMVVVYIDQNDIVFPPPQVPSSYIFVPGNPKEQSISRLGPAPKDMVEQDLARFINMKNEKISLYKAFYK
jgi:hypothetical protein